MSKAGKIVLVIVIVLVVIAFAKDAIIKAAVETGARQVVGANVKIGHLALGLSSQSLTIKDFKVYNPPGFPENEVLVDIPEAAVKCDIPAMLKGEMHVPYVRLNLNELRVIRNEQGKLNVNSLKFMQQQPAAGKEKEEKPAPTEKKQEKPLKMQLDLVSLNIGRVTMVDMSAGTPPKVNTYEVNVKEKEYKNVTNAAALASLITVEALKPTAIKGISAYAASALGVAVLPVGVASLMMGKDSAEDNFTQPFDKVYSTTTSVLKSMGSVKSEDKSGAVPTIKGEVQGASITIEVHDNKPSGVSVKVTARKTMMPKPEIAGGVLNEIRGQLGK